MDLDDDGKSCLSRQTHARPAVRIGPGRENDVGSKLVNRPAKCPANRSEETISVPPSKYARRKPVPRVVNSEAVEFVSPVLRKSDFTATFGLPLVRPTNWHDHTYGVSPP